jgi:dipeptidyl aminopeptidase/acylaminoacyl peptidase
MDAHGLSLSSVASRAALVLCWACGGAGPVAQTSSGVVEEKPPPTRVESVKVTSRTAPVPEVRDPGEVIVYLAAGSVWMRKADGSGQPVALTSRSADGPAHSPGLDRAGASLVYAAPVNGVYRIHVMSLADKLARVVNAGGGPAETEPAWAPDRDSARIAYMRGDPQERRDLVVRSLDAGDTRVLVAGDDDRPQDAGMPAWSPDGRTIAFVADRRRGKGSLIWLADTGTGRLRALTPPLARAPFLRDRDPSFSPDGTRVVFASNRHANSVDRAGDFDIYSISLDGFGLTRLTDDPGTATDPVYSIDGQRILFVSTRDSQHSYESEIYVMPASGGSQRRLTRDARPQNSAPSSARIE